MYTNCQLPVRIVHAYARAMRERGHGSFILVSSLASLQGAPGLAVYASSKAFLRVFGEGLWGELHPSGIDVLTVCPSAIKKPGGDVAANRVPGELAPHVIVRQSLPALGRRPLVVPGAFNRFAAAMMTRIFYPEDSHPHDAAGKPATPWSRTPETDPRHTFGRR